MNDTNKYKERMFEQYLSINRTFVKREDIEKVVLDTMDSILIFHKDGEKEIYNPYFENRRLVNYSSVFEMTEDDMKKEFSFRLKDMLIIKGWTQKDLADRLGVSAMTVSRYIHRDRMPNASMIYRIAKLLNRKMEEFYYDEEDINL